MVYNNQRLLLRSDLKIVLLKEVLGNTLLLAILHVKERVAWAMIELQILDDVGSLVSVIGYNALMDELFSASLMECLDQIVLISPITIIYYLVVDLINSIKNSLG